MNSTRALSGRRKGVMLPSTDAGDVLKREAHKSRKEPAEFI